MIFFASASKNLKTYKLVNKKQSNNKHASLYHRCNRDIAYDVINVDNLGVNRGIKILRGVINLIFLCCFESRLICDVWIRSVVCCAHPRPHAFVICRFTHDVSSRGEGRTKTCVRDATGAAQGETQTRRDAAGLACLIDKSGVLQLFDIGTLLTSSA